MKKIVLTFGVASGAILAVMTGVMMPLYKRGTVDFDQGEVVGWSSMVLAFLLVFFGILSYRKELGGTISFGKALQVGLMITLVTCGFYVLCWELVYWFFYPEFLDEYHAHALAKMRVAGETEAAISKEQADMVKFARLYANPLFNIAVTFLEIFPVGLIVSLISAAILRRKPAGGAPAAATA